MRGVAAAAETGLRVTVWPSLRLRPLMMTPAPAPERSGFPLRSSVCEPARRLAEPLRMSWPRAPECTADREMMGAAAAEAASSGLTGASSMGLPSSSLLWFPSDSLGHGREDGGVKSSHHLFNQVKKQTH